MQPAGLARYADGAVDSQAHAVAFAQNANDPKSPILSWRSSMFGGCIRDLVHGGTLQVTAWQAWSVGEASRPSAQPSCRTNPIAATVIRQSA
jgi:hypothetical protein